MNLQKQFKHCVLTIIPVKTLMGLVLKLIIKYLFLIFKWWWKETIRNISLCFDQKFYLQILSIQELYSTKWIFFYNINLQEKSVIIWKVIFKYTLPWQVFTISRLSCKTHSWKTRVVWITRKPKKAVLHIFFWWTNGGQTCSISVLLKIRIAGFFYSILCRNTCIYNIESIKKKLWRNRQVGPSDFLPMTFLVN